MPGGIAVEVEAAGKKVFLPVTSVRTPIKLPDGIFGLIRIAKAQLLHSGK